MQDDDEDFAASQQQQQQEHEQQQQRHQKQHRKGGGENKSSNESRFGATDEIPFLQSEFPNEDEESEQDLFSRRDQENER